MTTAYYGVTDVQNTIAIASNVIQGTNPEYLLSDFYATYPAFAGRSASGTTILTATLNTGGLNYTVNDILTIADGTGGVVRVDTVDTLGVILTYTLLSGGTGYEVTTGATVTGGSGTGATFDIAIDTVLTYLVDPVVIQMYIDIATHCIQQARYHSYWKTCIGWFVAHFVTLYLQSVAGVNASAQQVMVAAQSRGLQASKSVGDVSVSYDYNSIMNDLDGWAQWKLTVYGTQLATIAKMIGKGGMMVW